ncbi:MAG: DUF420 domain-containing protein [Candidatus Zixiibacteriota bacterium]
MSVQDLPTVNASLNLLSATFLMLGYLKIRRGERDNHRKLMLSALVCSALFLTSYLIYHFNVGSLPYPHQDWTRPVYFAVLIPHVVLAALMTPFILILVRRAWRGDFARHRRMARVVWPVWMFVSVTGVVIYCMLYLRAAPEAG